MHVAATQPMKSHTEAGLIQSTRVICVASRKKFDWLILVWWRNINNTIPRVLLQRGCVNPAWWYRWYRGGYLRFWRDMLSTRQLLFPWWSSPDSAGQCQTSLCLTGPPGVHICLLLKRYGGILKRRIWERHSWTVGKLKFHIWWIRKRIPLAKWHYLSPIQTCSASHQPGGNLTWFF